MTKPVQDKERRKYVRVPEEDLLICEPFDGASLDRTLSRAIHAFTKSLSEGGLLFESSRFFDLGTLLKLQVNLPGWQKYKSEFYKSHQPPGRNPLIVLGKVVRVECVAEDKFDIGVVFTAVDSGHKLALKKYIGQHYKGEPTSASPDT